jgi:hypothetical protein
VPDGAKIGAMLVASHPDQGQNPAHAAVRAIILAVVSGIGDQAADIGTDARFSRWRSNRVSLTLAAEATAASGRPSASTTT